MAQKTTKFTCSMCGEETIEFTNKGGYEERRIMIEGDPWFSLQREDNTINIVICRTQDDLDTVYSAPLYGPNCAVTAAEDAIKAAGGH